jgi:DNA modification methylase
MYVEHLVELFREVKRVLKKTGSLWLNIGDTYAGSHCGRGDKTLFQNFRRRYIAEQMYLKPSPQAKVDLPPKCLMGIPWRVALAMIDDGWILRNAIIWHKPNAMPSSVKDRLAQTYEYIFHFVKSRKYYYCLDNIREPHRTIPTPNPLKNDVEKFSFNKLIEYCLKKYEKAMKERKPYNHKEGENIPESFKSASEWNRGSRETMNKIIDSLNIPEEVKVKLRSWWHDVQSHPKGKNIGDTWKWSEETREMGWYHNLGRIRQLMRMLGLPEQNPLGRNPGDIFNIPMNSKYLEANVKTASPAARSIKTLMNGKLTTHVKQRILDVGAYLKSKLRESGYTIKQLAEITGVKQTTLEHYFRTDFSGQALPSRETWNLLKPLLNLGEYDDFIDEEIRLALPQPHPLGRNPGDYFSIPTKPFKGAHFAVFPPELPLRPILASCPPDGIVLDPLAGSGTVAYTCELINRGMWDEFRIPVNETAKSVKWNLKWILIEINPEYCKLAEERLKPFIKQKRLDEFKRT